MQETWIQGLDWDQRLPDELKNKWISWVEDLKQIQQLRIPRCLKNRGIISSKRLHTFVDASVKAYAACVYMRCIYEDGTVSTQLIASKSRVAPTKSLSIPELELMAAYIGVELTQRINRNLQISEIEYWSDSMDVIFWIRNQSRNFKTFVATESDIYMNIRLRHSGITYRKTRTPQTKSPEA
ncbi:uncharacterized protein LOC141898990 [Tubulanus polymorphus]|uniref:uncharacterized protein LOC141898990 n=1 Tax=Tubulanus polymorphus TaxID=672921 RepID=UPI003DA6BBD8